MTTYIQIFTQKIGRVSIALAADSADIGAQPPGTLGAVGARAKCATPVTWARGADYRERSGCWLMT